MVLVCDGIVLRKATAGSWSAHITLLPGSSTQSPATLFDIVRLSQSFPTAVSPSVTAFLSRLVCALCRNCDSIGSEVDDLDHCLAWYYREVVEGRDSVRCLDVSTRSLLEEMVAVIEKIRDLASSPAKHTPINDVVGTLSKSSTALLCPPSSGPARDYVLGLFQRFMNSDVADETIALLKYVLQSWSADDTSIPLVIRLILSTPFLYRSQVIATGLCRLTNLSDPFDVNGDGYASEQSESQPAARPNLLSPASPEPEVLAGSGSTEWREIPWC